VPRFELELASTLYGQKLLYGVKMGKRGKDVRAGENQADLLRLLWPTDRRGWERKQQVEVTGARRTDGWMDGESGPDGWMETAAAEVGTRGWPRRGPTCRSLHGEYASSPFLVPLYSECLPCSFFSFPVGASVCLRIYVASSIFATSMMGRSRLLSNLFLPSVLD
jgi:hypothetical protein